MNHALFIAVTALLVGAVSCAPERNAPTASANESAWNLEKKRAWAASLRADGLDRQALAAYQNILDTEPDAGPALVKGLSMNMAEIHFENADYQNALGAIYRARLYGLDGDMKQRADRMAIEALERLGRGDAADRLLDKVTGLDAKAARDTGSGIVVAEIGEETITLGELESLIAASNLAPEGRVGARKLDVLKTLVAQKVMERKAKKLGYDRDDKVKLALKLAERDVLMRKLVSEELKDELTLKEEDVRLYFEAKRERFGQPAELEVAQIVVADEAAEKAVRAALAEGREFADLARTRSLDEATKLSGGRVEQAVVEGKSHPLFARVGDVFAAVRGTPEGDVAADAMVTSRGRHILQVLARREGRAPTFDEVKEDVARALLAERERAGVERLFQEALATSDVQIHAERLE